MDPSALIFVALAVAWAAYLIPKALEHHEESVRSRTVQTFSHTMRVLARREPAGRTTALVPGAGDRSAAADAAAADAEAASADVGRPTPQPARPVPAAARRRAAAVAARRRRNVLGLLLLGLAVVGGLAQFAVITWPWTAIPGGLIVAWLVACRVMVKKERRTATVRRPRATVAQPPAAPVPTTDVVDDPLTEDIPVAVDGPEEYAEPTDPTGHGWAPVDVPLPTYVSKPAAPRRSVSTIDLDSTGVWTSGRTAADSALAREAEEADRAQRAQAAQAAEERRVSGA